MIDRAAILNTKDLDLVVVLKRPTGSEVLWTPAGGSKMKLYVLLFPVVFSLLILACGSNPTPTAVPTSTPLPTPTPAPQTFSMGVVVEPGATETVRVPVQPLNRVEGEITVQGGSGNDIDFWITDPSGNTIVQAGRVSQRRSFSFISSTLGNYSLHLGNTFSLFSNKIVNYSFTIYWR